MTTKATEEFKREAVRIALSSGLSCGQVAADLGVGHSTLNNWVKAFGDTGTVPGKEAEPVKGIERLRRALRIVTEEREVPQKQQPSSRLKSDEVCVHRRILWQLARLTRVDEEVIDRILERDDIYPQPYGVSLREMAEMTAGDQLYRYRQWSLGLDDMPGWLAQFLGFTSTVASSDKDDAAA